MLVKHLADGRYLLCVPDEFERTRLLEALTVFCEKDGWSFDSHSSDILVTESAYIVLYNNTQQQTVDGGAQVGVELLEVDEVIPTAVITATK
jgi:hypothetical protein